MPADQIITGSVSKYADPAEFSLPARGALGNLQRDFLPGPATLNFDYAVMSEMPIKEQVRVQLRAEFFNLFNHANFALPNADSFVQTANGGGGP